MPATRITLARNSKQTLRSVMLLQQADDDPDKALASILDAAEKKLRIKKPSRIFLASDGSEITAARGLARITNDAVLLVSSGEDFIGPSPKLSQQHDHHQQAPTRILCSSDSFLDEHIDPAAITQLNKVARLPGIVRTVGMPDLHPGDEYPVGAAFEAKGCIYPVLIGGDVGCGMALYQTRLPCSTHPKRICEKLRGIEGAWTGGSVAEWLSRGGVKTRSAFDDSLGTIGGSNHFAEIQEADTVLDKDLFTGLGLNKEKLVLLVHSGSRGLGRHIAASQPQLSLVEKTPEFDSYMRQHDMACNWARSNRDLIAHRILSCLTESPAHKVLDIWHNNVTQKQLNSDGEDGAEHSVWIHRKGAAPSDQGPVVIPGSRGSLSYLVLPTGEQRENSFSLAHGAGRSLTRTQARSKFQHGAPTVNASAAALHETALGSRVICEDLNLLFEEAPEAYKKIEAVVEDLQATGHLQEENRIEHHLFHQKNILCRLCCAEMPSSTQFRIRISNPHEFSPSRLLKPI